MKNFRALAALVASSVAAALNAQTYVAQEVSTGGFANAISNGIVGGSLANRATLWNGSGSLDVQPANASFSAILGRSGALSVGYAGTSSLAQSAIAWAGVTPTVLPIPFAYVTARGVDTDGVQIVGYGVEGNLERGAGAQHALLWNVATGSVVDLGKNMQVYGVGGGQQAGGRVGSSGVTAGYWSSSANSFVSLHPKFAAVSVATGANGTTQVGYYGVDVRVRFEGRQKDIRFFFAGYWTGTADSFTYLPSGYRHSFAQGMRGDTIFGYGNTTDAIGMPQLSHALAWVGPNHDCIDLHALLPADMTSSRATGVDESGNVVGWGTSASGVVRSFVWLRQ